ncbi:MAG: dihydrofolate reductase [Phycisphaerae bacterium]
MRISMIAAMTDQRLIGDAGQMPWHVPADLKFFKATTLDHTLLMGRKTFASIGNRPLPRRRHLIISRTTPPETFGVEWYTDITQAIMAAKIAGETELFIAGGGEIYQLAMPLADRLYITHIHHPTMNSGDTYFPAWDPTRWQLTSHQEAEGCTFVIYDRIPV